MHTKGVEVSLDDFGTGYCNLVSVLSMDVDVIKLDKSLLWAAQKDQKTAIMMKSLTRYYATPMPQDEVKTFLAERMMTES